MSLPPNNDLKEYSYNNMRGHYHFPKEVPCKQLTFGRSRYVIAFCTLQSCSTLVGTPSPERFMHPHKDFSLITPRSLIQKGSVN